MCAHISQINTHLKEEFFKSWESIWKQKLSVMLCYVMLENVEINYFYLSSEIIFSCDPRDLFELPFLSCLFTKFPWHNIFSILGDTLRDLIKKGFWVKRAFFNDGFVKRAHFQNTVTHNPMFCFEEFFWREEITTYNIHCNTTDQKWEKMAR